jgi:hypothetical protein
MPPFREGDRVLLKNKKTRKIDPLWFRSYNVLKIDHNGPNAFTELTKQKVHINRLDIFVEYFRR